MSVKDLDFTECVFPGAVDFRGCVVEGTNFSEAEFHGKVAFDNAQLLRTSFSGAVFHDSAIFEAMKGGDVDFSSTHFLKDAWFQGCELAGSGFYRCECNDSIHFAGTVFTTYVNLEWCEFRGYANFGGVEFCEDVKLLTTAFEDASFEEAVFQKNAIFRDVTAEHLTFERAVFKGSMDFRQLRIRDACSFRAVDSKGDVDLSNSRFDNPPDFTLSSFRRDPRLDSVRIKSRWYGFYTRSPTGLDLTTRKPPRVGFWIDEHAPAKFRELKRIASNTHDGINELEFHAQEIRSSRFVTDWPIPWPGKSIQGVARFWLGLAYGAFGDFGRSVLLPLLWWMLLVVVSTGLYLGQQPEVRDRRALLASEHNFLSAYLLAIVAAWREAQPCTSGLPESVRRLTDAPTEAVQIAVMNGVLFADMGADGSRRAYGCLYGTEGSSATSPALISPQVNWIARVQRTLSVVLIFLFGLGLRNKLKMK
jgi:uncharacterized protein YjbI with pentapeptide repeats